MTDEARLMLRPRIARPAEDSKFQPAVTGYDIVAVTPTQTISVVDEHGISTAVENHLEIAAGFCAYPLLIEAAEDAIRQIEHMAHQLGVPGGTGTSNATLATLRKALDAAQAPKFVFENEGDEEILRQKLDQDAAPAFRR
jgi:hypothetical protein